jgi:hypothetical protein
MAESSHLADVKTDRNNPAVIVVIHENVLAVVTSCHVIRAQQAWNLQAAVANLARNMISCVELPVG